MNVPLNTSVTTAAKSTMVTNDAIMTDIAAVPTSPVSPDSTNASSRPGTPKRDSRKENKRESKRESKHEGRGNGVRFHGILRQNSGKSAATGTEDNGGGDGGPGEPRLSASIMNRFFSRNRSQVALTRVRSKLATLMVLPDKGRDKNRIRRTRVTADALPFSRNRNGPSAYHARTPSDKDGAEDADEEGLNESEGVGQSVGAEGGENGRIANANQADAVKRSESEKNERRGRSLFRGIGSHFSTSAIRRTARSPTVREREGGILSRIRWRRTISPSPPPRARRSRNRRTQAVISGTSDSNRDDQVVGESGVQTSTDTPPFQPVQVNA